MHELKVKTVWSGISSKITTQMTTHTDLEPTTQSIFNRFRPSWYQSLRPIWYQSLSLSFFFSTSYSLLICLVSSPSYAFSSLLTFFHHTLIWFSYIFFFVVITHRSPHDSLIYIIFLFWSFSNRFFSSFFIITLRGPYDSLTSYHFHFFLLTCTSGFVWLPNFIVICQGPCDSSIHSLHFHFFFHHHL